MNVEKHAVKSLQLLYAVRIVTSSFMHFVRCFLFLTTLQKRNTFYIRDGGGFSYMIRFPRSDIHLRPFPCWYHTSITYKKTAEFKKENASVFSFSMDMKARSIGLIGHLITHRKKWQRFRFFLPLYLFRKLMRQVPCTNSELPSHALPSIRKSVVNISTLH